MVATDNILGNSRESQRSPTDQISLSSTAENNDVDCQSLRSHKIYRDAAESDASTCMTLSSVCDRIVDTLVSANGSERST